MSPHSPSLPCNTQAHLIDSNPYICTTPHTMHSLRAQLPNKPTQNYPKKIVHHIAKTQIYHKITINSHPHHQVTQHAPQVIEKKTHTSPSPHHTPHHRPRHTPHTISQHLPHHEKNSHVHTPHKSHVTGNHITYTHYPHTQSQSPHDTPNSSTKLHKHTKHSGSTKHIPLKITTNTPPHHKKHSQKMSKNTAHYTNVTPPHKIHMLHNTQNTTHIDNITPNHTSWTIQSTHKTQQQNTLKAHTSHSLNTHSPPLHTPTHQAYETSHSGNTPAPKNQSQHTHCNHT